MKTILIGFAACYKTTVGKLLSQKFNCRFFDVDEQIEAAEQKTVAEIFSDGGERAFRAAETDVLLSLQSMLQSQSDLDCVIACGGGSVLSPTFLDFSNLGIVVWLTANAQTVKSRLTFGTRPLFDGLSTCALEQKIVEREALYASFADFSVSTDGKTSSAVAEEVFRLLISSGPCSH